MIKDWVLSHLVASSTHESLSAESQSDVPKYGEDSPSETQATSQKEKREAEDEEHMKQRTVEETTNVDS